ncbi:hypothetical protein HID58_011704 [Brassica napus]|uniref:(rape) hypothetical protein n=1 Tax=Brassica napus TaxID=3708 RepID=A0A816W430_BRANA|nr:uncharacterized protein LOC106389673 [Brassica napus]KAH0934587.1 hypothetical protein HID58_011704 [Brassica napus]CAF2128585.1 unnamed protein product [Brassica napus]
MQAFYIFVVSLLLTLNYRGEASGSVFFIDGSNNQYLRPPSAEALPMSLSEISASVSALLGFAPPSTLTAHGSSKLNKILKPNPFERPRAAFVLEIAGAHDALVEDHSFLGNAIRGSISSDSYNADIELPESGVAVVSVNEPSSDVTDKDMNEFASWLGGSYVTGSAEPLTGLLSIPLAGAANVEFHLEKEAERKFALNLLDLYKNIRGAVNLHGIEQAAELTIGRFGGIHALAQEYGQGMAKQGMDVLLATLSKLFDLLETSHKGQIVGVIVLDERVNQESANLLSVESSSRSSARSMAEVEGVPSGAIIAQVILVRLTLAWLTGIILLIATLLGVYFLMYMPLTKDTLLYSNVKLD